MEATSKMGVDYPKRKQKDGGRLPKMEAKSSTCGQIYYPKVIGGQPEKKKKDGKKRNPWCDNCNAEYQGDCPECTFIHDDGVFTRRILLK